MSGANDVALGRQSQVIKGVTGDQGEGREACGGEHLRLFRRDHTSGIDAVFEHSVRGGDTHAISRANLPEVAEERVTMTSQDDVSRLTGECRLGQVSHGAMQNQGIGPLSDDGSKTKSWNLDAANEAARRDLPTCCCGNPTVRWSW